jgi:ABC-type polysaccharide/polyol phosphate export permease
MLCLYSPTVSDLARRIATDGRLPPIWTARELRIRYSSTRLGLLWALIQPVAMLAVFGFVFARVLDVSSGRMPYLSFAFAGLLCWVFTASSVNAATGGLLSEAVMVTRAYFQRELKPLATVAACVAELLLATVIFFVLFLAQGVSVSVTLLALIPAFSVLIVWTMALATFAASITVFFRDVRHALPLLLQLLFVATPIMYPRALLPAGADWLAVVNPVAVVIDSVRAAALRHVWPNWELLFVQGAAGAGALAFAVLYTRRVEPRMADVL